MNLHKTHPLTVRVDDHVYNRIVEMAQKRGLEEKRLVTMTEILREAIEEKANEAVKTKSPRMGG